MQSLIASCENAEQFGKSRTFNLYFPSRDALDTATQMPIKCDFERYRMQELFISRNFASIFMKSAMRRHSEKYLET